MALWNGSNLEWARLIAAISSNCEPCMKERIDPLCADHRALLYGSQRFLDGMLSGLSRRAELIAQENSRTGGVSR